MNKAKISPHRALDAALQQWRQAMNNMSQYDCSLQIALYLLCWGEATQVRFVPKCLCFIFKCADDYYQSPHAPVIHLVLSHAPLSHSAHSGLTQNASGMCSRLLALPWL